MTKCEVLAVIEALAAADEDIRPPAVATSATLPPDPFPVSQPRLLLTRAAQSGTILAE